MGLYFTLFNKYIIIASDNYDFIAYEYRIYALIIAKIYIYIFFICIGFIFGVTNIFIFIYFTLSKLIAF